MDVIGGALGHALFQKLMGQVAQAGVRIAAADIFGTMTEAYANQPSSFDPPDYSIGEEVGSRIQYMHDPSHTGDLNCYSDAVRGLNDTVAAAGPMNHWFYLLAEGSSPTNGQPQSTTCNGTRTWGIGVRAAGQIFYNALGRVPFYDRFLDYRKATLDAAKALTPGACDMFMRTKQAWDAINVPAQPGEPTCIPLRLEVLDPLVATVGTPVTIRLKGNGGDGTYTFSAGGLPPGLTLNTTTGVISGRPTTAGTYYPGLAVLSQGTSNFMQPPFTVHPKPA